jgi:hypothetical protein
VGSFQGPVWMDVRALSNARLRQNSAFCDLLKYGWHLICRWVGEDWEFIFVLASSGLSFHVGLRAFDIHGLIIDLAFSEIAVSFF